MGLSLDITERKRAEGAMLASEQRFRALAESALVGIYVLQDGKYAYVNPAMAHVFGYSVAEMTGMSPREIVQPCDYGMVSENIQRRITGEVQAIQYEVRGKHKDGSTRDVEVYGTRIEMNGRPALVGTLIDITERKLAETKLEESRTQIAAVMNSTKDFIWSVDPERFGLLTWNRAFSDYFFEQRGIDLEVGMTPEELVPPDYVPLWHGLFSSALRKGLVVTEYVVVAQTITLLLSLYAMKKGDKVFGISVFGKDITERKRAEQELRQSEERFRQVAESVGDFIWEVDANGLYRYTSPAVEKILGYTPDELIGKMHFYDLFAPEIREELKAAAFKVSAAQKSFRKFPNQNVSKDGKIVNLETSGVPVLDEAGILVGYRGSDTDVTARKQADEAMKANEAALRNSQKDLQKLAGRLISAQEEELRRLSRELHDDLTQRLAVLAIETGKLELDLIRMPERCPETVHTVAQIKNQLIKVSEDVHMISRQLHPTILDDLGLVRAIESECSAVMRRHPVEIVFRRENVPDTIPSDIGLCLYRVVQEGLRNIAAHSGSKNCEIFLKCDDHSICLTVSDDGIGFDPLQVRKMPGLGLSSMRERVQLIQGDFSIISQPGKGTMISAWVPLTGGEI
jgi:PAS domain S-box-containing protein